MEAAAHHPANGTPILSEDPFVAIDDAVAGLRAHSSSLEASLTSTRQEVASLRLALAASEEAAQNLRAALSQSVEEAAAASGARDAAIEEAATLRTRLEQRDRAVEAALEQASTARRMQQRAEEQAEELAAKISRRDEALRRQTEQERERNSTLLALQDEARARREERDAARQEAERAHAANATLRERVREREERLTDVMRRARDAPNSAPLSDVSNIHAASPGGAAAGAVAGGAGDAAAAVRFAKRVLDATRADATGGALEEVSARLFRVCLGYSVDRVGGSHDRGIDLKMRSADDVPCVAQCKSKRSGDVSFVEVSAFLGAMGIAGVMHGLFVTNAAFTAAARKAAEEWAAAAPERALHLYSCEELSAMCCKHHPALAQDHYVQSLLEHAAVMPQHTPQRRRAELLLPAAGVVEVVVRAAEHHGKRSPRQPEEAAAVLQRALAGVRAYWQRGCRTGHGSARYPELGFFLA